MSRTSLWMSIVTVSGLICSCATPAPSPYDPNLNAAPAMSVEQARNTVSKLTVGSPALFFDASKKTGLLEIYSVSISPSLMQVTPKGTNRPTYNIPLADIVPHVSGEGTGPCGDDMDGYTQIDLDQKGQGFYFVHPTQACLAVHYRLDNPLTRTLQAVRNGDAHEITVEESKQIADALVVLRNNANKLAREDEARFRAGVSKYLASGVRPALPESARRYAVQAESAIRDNDFMLAAMYFKAADDIAPWWPAGHYQRAILLSGVDDYRDAIVEMKRYILLAPKAPNARAAQDKIYDWERNVPSTPPQAPK